MNLDDLLDDPKSLTRYRVLRSTRPLLAERGLSVSMDDIAEAAGVSRRSLFRHFESRNALIADTLDSALEDFYRHLDDAVAADGELQDWLAALTRRLFTVQIDTGVAAWQIASASDDELPPELAAVNRRRRESRRRFTEVVAEAAWTRAGGRALCPPVVADAVALTISTFTSRSLLTDYGLDLDQLVDLVVAVLTAVIDRELANAPAKKRRTTSKTSTR